MTKLIILGCGSSVGSPWITNNWGKCDRKNKFNIRTRCSAFIKKGDLSILIDTSPDIKVQILDNKIKKETEKSVASFTGYNFSKLFNLSNL